MPTPGLYGNATQLQIDVSRLPRMDQYRFSNQTGSSQTNQSASSMPVDRLSDVKNVTYYLYGESFSSGAGEASSSNFGLIRREVDRASSVASSEQNQTGGLSEGDILLASEVKSIEFLYFDGSDWLDYWDSSVQGSLPSAVEITLKISRPPKKNDPTPDPGVYRLVVSIPTSAPSTSE
jgi:hypothetical protein